MAGGWGLLVELCLPVPFVLLILLTVPAPRSFNRTVLTLVDRTLGVRFVGTFSLLHIMLVVTGAAFLATIRATMGVSKERRGVTGGEETPGMIASHLAKKWRNERNFWISFICFVLWWASAAKLDVSVVTSPPLCLMLWVGEAACVAVILELFLLSLLARLHKIMVDKAQLEDRIRALSGPGAATKPASSPPPASTVPKKTS